MVATTGLGAIDFENDPIGAMSLEPAQVRDWLTYLFFTSIYFEARLPELRDAIDAALAQEQAPVRDAVARVICRTAWPVLCGWLPRRM